MEKVNVYVTGVGRSGTSAVASFLLANGWNAPGMLTNNSPDHGDWKSYPKNEPQALVKYINNHEAPDRKHIQEFHSLFNGGYPSVYKVPDFGINFIEALPDNVIPIIVIRDPRHCIQSMVQRSKDKAQEHKYIDRMHDCYTQFRFARGQGKKIYVINFDNNTERNLCGLFGMDTCKSVIDMERPQSLREPTEVKQDSIDIYTVLRELAYESNHIVSSQSVRGLW